MDCDIYVYYRVPNEYSASAKRSVMALFDDLRSSTGIQGRIARRRDDPGTWMEVYERVGDGTEFQKLLNDKVMRHRLGEFVDSGSPRKTEIFVRDVLDPEAREEGTACA